MQGMRRMQCNLADSKAVIMKISRLESYEQGLSDNGPKSCFCFMPSPLSCHRRTRLHHFTRQLILEILKFIESEIFQGVRLISIFDFPD